MDPWEVAQAQVAVKYDPQQQALQRQLDLAGKNTASNEASLNTYGAQGRDIIGNNFANLYNWLDYGKATQQQDLGKAVDATNQAFTGAMNDIQGYTAKSRSYLDDMARALGQEGAGYRANTELASLSDTQLGRALAARTNYGTNLSDWMTKMGTIADMGISGAHQNEATQKASFEAELMKALGENKLAGTTQETDMMNKISDLMGVRQSDLIAMYNELAAAEWEHQFQQAQLDQQAAQANADLQYKYSALSEQASEAAASRSASSASDALGWAKLDWDKQHTGAQDAAAATQQAWENAFNQRGQDLTANPKIDRVALGSTLMESNPGLFHDKKGNFDMGGFMRWVGGDDSALNPPLAPASSGNSAWGLGSIGNIFHGGQGIKDTSWGRDIGGDFASAGRSLWGLTPWG